MRRLTVLLLAAAACAAAADPRLMRLVMPEARVVSGINMAQLKKSAFGRFLLARFSESKDAEFDGFVQASGFDPRQNLDEVLFASAGGSGARRLVLARGAFQPGRIAEAARANGAEVASFRGVELIRAGLVAFAFLDASTAVAGDPAEVRGAIERRSSGGGPSAAIARKAQALSAVSDAWFVSTVPIAELVQDLPENNMSGALKGDALKTIEQSSGGVSFGEVVRFSAELVASSAEDAAGLAGILQLLAGMMQSGQANQPGAARPLDKLDLKAEGNLVRVGLVLKEAQVESLLREAGK